MFVIRAILIYYYSNIVIYFCCLIIILLLLLLLSLFFSSSSSLLLLIFSYYYIIIFYYYYFITFFFLFTRHLQQLLKFILFTLDFTRRFNLRYHLTLEKGHEQTTRRQRICRLKKQLKTVRCPWILLERKSRSHFGKS